MGQPAIARPDQPQSCIGCGATLHLPKGKEAPLCFRCRASFGSVLSGDPAAVPFQKILSPGPRASLSPRATGLLFLLTLVIAAIVSLPKRRAVAPATASQSASAPRGDSTRRQSGVTVILMEHSRVAPTATAAPSAKP